MVWEWSNDPEVRRISFSPDPIPWGKHVQWFQSKLNDHRCVFFIPVDQDDIPIGQVRFDTVDHECNISVSLDKRFRGKGYGTEAIRLATRKIFVSSDITRINAYVKEENEASAHAFLKAGFVGRGSREVNGYPARHLVLQKSDWP